MKVRKQYWFAKNGIFGKRDPIFHMYTVHFDT